MAAPAPAGASGSSNPCAEEDAARRLELAQRAAADARRGIPQLEGPRQSSRENSTFVRDFFSASRLHFIGSWKTRFESLVDAMPPPPPRPALAPSAERTIAHVDMDCFFASVAARDRPEASAPRPLHPSTSLPLCPPPPLQLRGLPLAVAWGDSARGGGELASVSYEARSGID